MISKIMGKLDRVSETSALVNIGGLFYEIMLPSGLADSLRKNNTVGTEIAFHTLDYIEGGQIGNQYPRLVGFAELIDKEFFALYTSVSGMGIKKALKSLTIPISEIARAIETEEASILTRLPGVGPRLAEKIIAELKGKTARFALARESKPLAVAEVKSDIAEEALTVLLQLQYRRAEAQAILDRAISTGKRFKSVEELLQQVFKQVNPGANP